MTGLRNCFSMRSRSKNPKEQKFWASLRKALRTGQSASLVAILKVPHAVVVSATQAGPESYKSTQGMAAEWVEHYEERQTRLGLFRLERRWLRGHVVRVYRILTAVAKM